MKLECPDCRSVVTAKGTGAVRCPKCGFTSRVPGQANSSPSAKPLATEDPPGPEADENASAAPTFPGHVAPVKGKTNGIAVAALVTGIIGLIAFPPATLAALILGVVALNQCKERKQEGEGMALAGIIMGVIGIMFWMMIFGTGFFWL